MTRVKAPLWWRLLYQLSPDPLRHLGPHRKHNVFRTWLWEQAYKRWGIPSNRLVYFDSRRREFEYFEEGT